MVPALAADPRKASLAPGLLRISWFLTATVFVGLFVFPFLNVLNSWLGHWELINFLSIPFVLLWMILFAISKIVSAILLVFCAAVAVTPGIEFKTRIITSCAAGLVGLWLWIS
jgi:hypothetical protein